MYMYVYIYIYVHIQYTCTSFHTLRSCIGDAAHVSPLSSTRSSQSCALVQFSPSVPDFVEEPKRVPRPSAIDSPVPKSAKRYSFGEVAFCRPMPSFYGNFTPQPSERPPVPSPLCPPKSFVRRGRPSPCGESVAAVARPAAASDSESDEAFLKKAREDSLSVRAVGGSLRRSYCEAAVEAGTAKTADLKSYKDLRNKVAEKQLKTAGANATNSKGKGKGKGKANGKKSTGKAACQGKEIMLSSSLQKDVVECIVHAENSEKAAVESGKVIPL